MNIKTHNRVKWQWSIVIILLSAFNCNLIAQNNGLSFNGVDEEAQVGVLSHFDDVSNLPFTIEAWFNPTQSVNQGTVWSFGTGSDRSIRLKQVAGGGMAVDGIDGDYIVGSSPSIAVNRWHHSAVVYDGTELILYIDGIEEGRATLVTPLIPENLGFRIGRGTFDFNNFWEGQIDELRIWKYPLSETEVFDGLFFAVDGTEAGLIHSYNFNETTGTILPDLAGVADGSTINMADGNWQASEAGEKQLNQSGGAGGWTTCAIWSR